MSPSCPPVRSRVRQRHQALKTEVLEPRRVLATFLVTTFADVIAPADGLLSLREAVIAANSNNEDDLIQLTSGTYAITLDQFGEDASLGGDFDILSDGSHAVTVAGTGSSMTFIDAGELDRAFELLSGSHLALEGITVRNGNILDQPVHTGRRGGAIKSTQSQLQLKQVVVENSTAGVSGVGGGVYVSGGSYSFTDTTIQSNFAELNGAALFARNATGSILRGRIQHNTWRESNDDFPSNDPGVSAIRGGTLHIQGTRIDNNHGGTGIAVTDSTLDVVHARFLDINTFQYPAVTAYGHSIFARDSHVTVHDSRFNIRHGDAIRFFGQAHDLEVTESLFLATQGSSIRFDGSDLLVSDSEFLMDGNLSGAHSRPVILVEASSSPTRSLMFQNVLLKDVSKNAIKIDGSNSDTRVSLDQVVLSDPVKPFTLAHSRMVDIVASDVAIHDSAFLDDLSRGSYVLNADHVAIANLQVTGLNSDEAFTIDAASIEIRNLDFFQNLGGIYIVRDGVNVLLADSSITGTVDGQPGKSDLNWFASNGSLTVFNTTFRDSQTHDASLGIRGNGNVVLIASSRFLDGSTSNDGIRIAGSDQHVTVANSLFANYAGTSSGINNTSMNSTLRIDSSTFAKLGTGSSFGAAIRSAMGHPLDVVVSNSIFIANGSSGGATSETDHINNPLGSTIVRFSAIDDLNPGDGNVHFGGAANGNTDAKPAFVDFINNDFHLKADSPLIDFGNTADLIIDAMDLDNDGDVTEPLSDLDLLTRVFGTAPDLGAFEFHTI